MELYLGECSKILDNISCGSVDLVLTSPPYDNLRSYNGYSFLFEDAAKQLTRVIKPGGVIVWVVGDSTVKGSETGTSFKQALYFKELGLNIHDTMIFSKQNYIPLSHNRYEQSFEYMFVLSKGSPKTFNALKIPCTYANARRSGASTFYQTPDQQSRANSSVNVHQTKIKSNIWTYLVGNTTKEAKKWRHPAKFPLQLAIDHIQSWSNPGDVVLDPFLGSGTTGVAALQLGRKFIGIEISGEYLEMAKNRILEETRLFLAHTLPACDLPV